MANNACIFQKAPAGWGMARRCRHFLEDGGYWVISGRNNF